MVSFNKFQDFVEQLGKGKHDFSTHTIKVYLSNEAPLAADTIKTDIADITAQNGYPAGGSSVTPVWSETPAGTGQLAGTDVVFTASGGSFGPFRYVILYNDSTTDPLDALIGWWDYGSSISCNDGETFTVDFGSSILTVT